MADLDLQTRRVLSERGVKFRISVQDEGDGYMPYEATPEDLVTFADDPAAIYAKAHGVTKTEYRDWIDDDCSAVCAAKTRTGRRCRNIVEGGYQVSPRKWLELQGGYCAVHGDRAGV